MLRLQRIGVFNHRVRNVIENHLFKLVKDISANRHAIFRLNFVQGERIYQDYLGRVTLRVFFTFGNHFEGYFLLDCYVLFFVDHVIDKNILQDAVIK